jgi:hypothetical protein
MSKFKTAKDILSSHDFLESRAKSQKYVKHEFQDYAYRLAVDLGDLRHRALYMKLAKTVDRTTLEQAAAWCMDYEKEKNKGKLFMWKLAQLRAANELKLAMRNLDHEFVMQRMAKLFDAMHTAINAKQKSQLEVKQKLVVELYHMLPEEIRRAKKLPKVLLGLGGAGIETKLWKGIDVKIQGIGISPALVRAAKTANSEAKIIRKPTFLKNTFDKHEFDIVWLSRLWELVPLESEVKYIKEIKRLTRREGYVFVEACLGETEQQKWSEFTIKEKSEIYFEKINTAATFETRFAAAGFKLITRGKLEEKREGYVWQLTNSEDEVNDASYRH